MTSRADLLNVRGLTKRFTGTLALDRVDFDVSDGEIHALLGENGAGKSTLIKILAGVYQADAGTVSFRGESVSSQRDNLQISFIHQDLGLVETMTVAENIALTAGYPRSNGLIDWAGASQQASKALESMGSGIAPDTRVADLPAAERSIVAIARALAVKTELLVLDEPTAALPEADVERLHAALRQLKAEGIGIIYVTHRLDEVFRIADRVTVLRDGKKVVTQAVSQTKPEELVFHIVGRALSDVFAKPHSSRMAAVLNVDSITARRVGPVSFSVRAGEVLGLVGLRGAGHDVIGRALFGDTPITSGRVTLDGKTYAPHGPGDAIRRGVGLVSSKRGQEGMASSLNVRENLYLNPLMTGRRLTQGLRVDAESRQADDVMQRFSVVPRDPERIITTLSGGNQQKVILARWMEADVRLLILEEPTFGVDVGSKAEIYRLLQSALDAGMAALLVSSDFEEVSGIAHRALVFDRGRVSAEVAHDDLSISHLTALASGATAREAS